MPVVRTASCSLRLVFVVRYARIKWYCLRIDSIEDGRFNTSRAGRLNNPGRIKELRPIELLREMAGVARAMTCIELGSGTGVFSLQMADLVGAEGVVYAVDNSVDMLNYMRAMDLPPNLRLVQADGASTGLDGEIADLCLMAFILHEVASPDGLMAEAYRLLKPGGMAVVVEWRLDADRGPLRSVRVSRETMERLFSIMGFDSIRYVEWSSHHCLVTGRKPVGLKV
jgi:SAM-dependent methyltransferase